MSTEAPAAPPPIASPNPDAPMAPPVGKFTSHVKSQIKKHDRSTKPAETATTQTATAPEVPVPSQSQSPATTQEPVHQAASISEASASQERPIPKSITGAKSADWDYLVGERDKYKESSTKHESQWKILDAEHRTLKSQHEMLAKERDEISKAREEYAKQLEVLEGLVQREGIIRDDRFKAAYDQPMDRILDTAKKLVGEKGDDLIAYMLAPDSKGRTKALEDIAAEMSPLVSGRIGAMLEKFEELRAAKQHDLENYKETAKKKHEADERARADYQKAELAKRDQRIGQALEKAKALETFKDEGAQTELRKILSGETDWETFSEITTKGLDYQRLEKENARLLKELNEAQAAAKELQGSNPGVRTAAGQQPGPETTNTPYGQSKFMAQVNKAFKKFERGPGG